jgi:hypothetical protein
MASVDSSPGAPALTNGHGIANGIHTNGDGPAFDPAPMRAYLSALLPALLGASPEELWSLFEDEFEERVARFAAEGAAVIYVTKIKHDLGGAWSLCDASVRAPAMLTRLAQTTSRRRTRTTSRRT